MLECAPSKYHKGFSECATEHTKKGIGIKKRGLCIPDNFKSIEEFKDHLKKLRESTGKIASGKIRRLSSNKIITKKKKRRMKPKKESFNIFNIF